jgi:triosephosphate isomerase
MAPLRSADATPRRLAAPFFEVGPKNLLRLAEVVDVATAAAAAGAEHAVSVIFTVPAPLIAPVRDAVPGVFVFAQSMDADEIGPSVGRVIAESLVDAGADGVMLNHDSNPLDADGIRRTVTRASENGLMTMVCAGSDAEAMDLLPLAPTIVLYEPPALIGRAEASERPWIEAIDARVRSAAPDVLMMHAGGVSAPDDAYRIMRAGAAGTGSTSGVLRDPAPAEAVTRFIAATRRGFDAARA